MKDNAMNIAVVTHTLSRGDGQGRVNFETVRHALRRGHHVTLVATNIDDELANDPGVTCVRIPVEGLPTTLLQDNAFARRSGAWLRKHRDQFDAVHVNGCITTVPGDVNAVHFVHGSWMRSPVHTFRVRRDAYGLYQYLYTALNARWEKQAFQAAGTVIAVSDQVRRELIEIGVPANKIEVIINGVDLNEFRPGSEDRRALGLPENVVLGLFAGDIRTPRKNLDTVLHALAQTPEMHLAVAGGVDQSPYPRMAEDLGVADRTHFLGFRRDMADLMRAADLFVFPSRYEACSLVMLEALSSGLPVVTARSAGGSEVVCSDCGFVLDDANDVAALAASLKTLAEDEPLRRSMGRAAREVAERHSWEAMADAYLALYARFAAKPTISGVMATPAR